MLRISPVVERRPHHQDVASIESSKAPQSGVDAMNQLPASSAPFGPASNGGESGLPSSVPPRT
eukprot:8862815-Alexandrium_andersonii.AAC.1